MFTQALWAKRQPGIYEIRIGRIGVYDDASEVPGTFRVMFYGADDAHDIATDSVDGLSLSEALAHANEALDGDPFWRTTVA